MNSVRTVCRSLILIALLPAMSGFAYGACSARAEPTPNAPQAKFLAPEMTFFFTVSSKSCAKVTCTGTVQYSFRATQRNGGFMDYFQKVEYEIAAGEENVEISDDPFSGLLNTLGSNLIAISGLRVMKVSCSQP